MKALLRLFENDCYVWKDVKYDAKGFYIDGDSDQKLTIDETNIVSLSNDNRKNYFKCSACGELFRKGSSKWEKHIQPITDSNRCFSCKYMRVSNAKKLNSKYVLLENGKYAQTQKSEVELKCYNSWHYPDINSEEARRNCYFNRCVNADVQPIEDIFTKNPGIFDDIITVDQIVKQGYKERYVRNHYWTNYKLKGKNQIWACVNHMNIVDHFEISYRNNHWTVYYSKKYNKLYHQLHAYGKGYYYGEWKPDHYYITPEAKEYIKKKIASLYD